MKISYKQLVELLKNTKGTTAVTITARTPPQMYKTDNPYKDAVKVSVVNGIIGFIYQNSVNRQRLREDNEPDFEAEPRKWGARIKGTPLVEHKDNFYLEVKVQKSIEQQYRCDGVIVPYETIKEFLKPLPSNPQQQLDKEVILRDYNLKNIEAININGQHYEIIGQSV